MPNDRPDPVADAHRARNADDFLYPPIEARESGFLAVDPPHQIYWDESGAPDGVPVVFLHGGPGSGTSPRHRRFFDPARWRIVLHDQRGAGRSTPFAELGGNTTQALVADIERLREARGVEKWVVFGGSWGSTLALAYAQAHPDRCLGLIVRGIFLGEDSEVDWFMHGLRILAPEAWNAFAEALPPAERGDLLGSYMRRLNDPEPAVNGPAAVAWGLYESSSSSLYPNPDLVAQMTADDTALAMSRIEAAYFVNRLFLKPGQLIEGVPAIRHIPGTIVQGRYDLLCPLAVADRLHRAWPEAEYVVVPDAGHSAFEPSIARELVAATDRMAARLAS
jgi:proline iminopeptidase